MGQSCKEGKAGEWRKEGEGRKPEREARLGRIQCNDNRKVLIVNEQLKIRGSNIPTNRFRKKFYLIRLQNIL